MNKVAFVEWTEKLSVGIKRIDDQHKRFIGLLNKAHTLVQAKKNKEVNKMLAEVLEYARMHFSTEEEIFDGASYPYASEHKIEHLKLIEKAIKFYDRVLNKEDVSDEFLHFLIDWLENHLKKYDFKYAKYFKENKIKV